MNNNKSDGKNEQLKNVAGGAGFERLSNDDLTRVAGGFEIARPLPEFITPNLKTEKKSDEHSEELADKTFPTERLV